jgi:hypothetical protein
MANGKRDTLKSHVVTTQSMIRRLVDDINDEESMMTLGNNPNHIKWLTGHLVFTAMLAGTAAGGKLAMPEGWGDIFRRGSQSPDKTAVFPAMPAVRGVLYEFQDKVQGALDQADDEFLDAKRIIAPNWEDTPVNAILFFCAHDFYHAGQIVMIRRAIGRERSFG